MANSMILKQNSALKSEPLEKNPHSIGVIMDGNRRWAKANKLFSFQGHTSGYQKLKDMVKWSKEAGISYLTVYAFSTENWKRPQDEVGYLMDLARYVFGDSSNSIRSEKVRVLCVGNLELLPKDLQESIAKTEKETAGYEGITLVVCISYGGRDEIVQAVKKIVREKGVSGIEKLTEADISNALYTASIPDPDLIIRTGGEMRTSNFLPWQSTYSELFFSKKYWPEFSQEDFKEILQEYSLRQRRIGK